MGRTRVKAHTISIQNAVTGFLFSFVVIATVLLATIARSEDTIIKSHGISTFGELKYGPDFKHFDYVNPNAPKGGEFSTWGFGTFDSLTTLHPQGSGRNSLVDFFSKR